MILSAVFAFFLAISCSTSKQPEPLTYEEPTAVAVVASATASGGGGAERNSATREGGDRDENVEIAVNTEIAAEKTTPPAEEDEDEEENEDSLNYWKGVQFDAPQFSEVMEFVQSHYIEENINESRQFAEACVYMMGGLDTPYLVLPKHFYETRKGNPDEEGALDGTTMPLKPGLDVVLVKAKKEEEEEDKEEDNKPKEKDSVKEKDKTADKKRKRLSDDEIRELRKKAQERQALLEQEWGKIKFDKNLMQSCMNKAIQLGKADPEQKDKPELQKRMWLGAAQGMLRVLDPHSSIVSAKAWEESTKKTTDSSFDGIGAILTQRDDMTLVESPIEGQPAFAAGVRAGDMIIRVDDKSIAGLPLSKVVKRIRGPRGTTVRLTLRREGEPEDLEIPIVRAYIENQNVTARLIKHHKDLGYLKLTGFVPTSADKIQEKITELESQTSTGRLRGLVFDLRSNSGGLLQQAVEIADLFLQNGDIVTVKDRSKGGKGEKTYRARPGNDHMMPIVVLVNDSSASASEIVASAIQDNGRGIVVGDRTFGKASVQTLFNPLIGKDYYIKLTVARYYSPSGRTIQVVGVRPDVEVPPEIGKPMPLGFREENLYNHLNALEANYASPNEQLVKGVLECANRRGIAEKVHQSDPNPQIRFDYQMYKAADFLECMYDIEVQAKASGATK
ncbi:MAG: S41 family peptidase [Myxococcales bacterium]|nr:S41 family peptidase [Myxococcales bacterium]